MTYTYDTRNITHNSKQAFYSAISRDTANNSVAYAAPVEITGLTGLKVDKKQDSEDVYADGVAHVTKVGVEQVTGELNTLQISQDFYSDLLGYEVVKIDGSSAVSLSSGGTRSNFVLGYAETVTDEYNNDYLKWSLYTNVKASSPSIEAATDEDKVSEATYTIPLTMSVNSNVKLKNGKRGLTEIIVSDFDGSFGEKVDAMFGDSPVVTVSDLLKLATGTTDVA